MIRLSLPSLLFIGVCAALSSTPLAEEHLFDGYSVDWCGTGALRAGDFFGVLDQIDSDTTCRDTAFRFLKLGCACQGLGELGRAVFWFRQAARTNSELSSFAYERIGNIEIEQGRIRNALKALRVALDGTRIPRYRYYLYERMYRLARDNADAVGSIAWLEEIFSEYPPTHARDIRLLCESLLDARAWDTLETVVQAFLDTSYYEINQCAVCSLLSRDSVPDTLFTTKALYTLSRLGFVCRRYDESSDWLHRALARRDFALTVPQRRYVYHRAELNYRLRNYNKAITWFRRYERKYGALPSQVYMVARSYRNLGKASKAAEWYDKHIRLYPDNAKSHDILWYRAWQKEDAGKLVDARRFYRSLFEKHPNRSKADDACFRYALSFYKEEQYDAALSAFSSFVRKYPDSPLAVGARYWKAKCLFAKKEVDQAREICAGIPESFPTEFYGYRSRELLSLMGDTTVTLRVDTTRTLSGAAAWLDSVAAESGRPPFTTRDSIDFRLGVSLAVIGMLDHAEMLLETFETSRVTDLLLQFQLAHLYRMCGDPTRTFRVAKRLSWRIPSSARPYMPVQVYSLLYPKSYMTYIAPSAKANSIDPELVSAIIRQESVFDPVIVSPAGAVGLMQIMPATGRDIADQLGENFSLDTLCHAETNIRYGAYYIGSLLRQFKGNMALAAAAYNGGPHNAKKWLVQNIDDGFDMFIEDIGFSETRDYTKRVLANYWTYRQLSNITKYQSQ